MFSVGDVVEKITDGRMPKGTICRVSGTAMGHYNGRPSLALIINAWPHQAGRAGWEHSGFRKITAPDTDLATRIRSCRPIETEVGA